MLTARSRCGREDRAYPDGKDGAEGRELPGAFACPRRRTKWLVMSGGLPPEGAGATVCNTSCAIRAPRVVGGMMAKRVTRGEVAARAGTSPAVVSYVLNDGPRAVAEATRARVLAAVEALGYRPNSIARSLRTSRTMTLGLIVPDTSNPFFGEASRAIEDAAFERGYMVVVGNAVESAQRQNSYIRAFADQRV